MSDKALVALVGDDPDKLDWLSRQLELEGFLTVVWFDDHRTTEIAERIRPSAIVVYRGSDHELEPLELLQDLRADDAVSDIPTVICTANLEFIDEHAGEIETLDGTVLARPIDIFDLVQRLHAVIEPEEEPSDSLVREEDATVFRALDTDHPDGNHPSGIT